MKLGKSLFGITVLSTVVALSAGATIYHNATRKETDAYDTTSLPTNINLNDCDESTVRNYYSNLNSLSVSERQGTNLLKNLKSILKKDQKYLSYDSGSSIWDVYCIVDRDWNKSPASALPAAAGTYNPSTNMITNYHWGGNSAKYENPYLHILYYNRNREPVAQAYGDHGNNTHNPTGINREHIWPKGAGFETESQGGARGDIMHLWAAHGHTNNKHSNYYYGYVDKTRTYEDEATDTPECAGNLKGYSKTLGGGTSVFEPQNCDKGDIARACFYMAARYNYYSGQDSDGINSNNPNLELVNELSSWQQKGYASTATTTGKLGIIQDLLEWNRLDPPDEFEIHRNNLCYRNFTNNRNPFIDFPNWADAIWGTVDENGNYDGTPSGSASPTNDPINTFTPVNTFGISNTSLTLEVDDTAEIYARNASGTVTWTVEDDSVVSLDRTSTTNNGSVTITALAAGTTTVTATCGDDSAACSITVNEPSGPEDPDHIFTVDLTDSMSVTNGFSITSGVVSDKGGYYQDGGTADVSTNYFKVYRATPLFSSQPASITFTARLGAGTSRTQLVHNVEACFVDSNGDEIASTKTTVTTSISSTATDYEVELPYSADAYGVKLMHVKTSNHNIRYYGFNLVSEGTFVPPPEPEDYIGNVSRFAGLYGTETTPEATDPETITFASLGLDNAVQYTDPFNGGHFTVTFSGGGNDGKYYDTGTGIRTYGGGKITVASSLTIEQINFTWDGSYKPTSNVANVGAYNSSNNTWTGSANSVTLTRPSGSGHWRLKSVTVTYAVPPIDVTGMSFKFGLLFPQEDWDTIADNWEISDYGFMIVKETTLQNSYHEDTVEDAYYANKRLQNLHKGDGDTPYSYESNYLFTVRLNIGENIAHSLRFCASPYIVIDDHYYFLGEIRCNINELANTCLTTGETNLSSEALTYLKTH